MIEIPFVWWTDLIIPGFTGLASVTIAVAALVATKRAGRIASEAEAHRLAAEGRARAAEERRRSLETRQEEARIVTRWIDLAFLATAAALASRNPRAELRFQAYADAKATLEHSFFPGARDLLLLTAIDTQNVMTTQIADGQKTSLVIDLDERTRYHRQGRALERVRRWALDPEGEAGPIRQELQYARESLDDYLAMALPPDE